MFDCANATFGTEFELKLAGFLYQPKQAGYLPGLTRAYRRGASVRGDSHMPLTVRFCHSSAPRLAIIGLAILTALPAFAEVQTQRDSAEAPFLQENSEAMSRMMNNMTVQPTGNIDEDFVAMMIPHHQGAVDMAQAELRYGHNERLRRIAQEIIVEQTQEVAAMQLAIGQPLAPSTPVPDQPAVSRTTSAPQAASQMHMARPKGSR